VSSQGKDDYEKLHEDYQLTKMCISICIKGHLFYV
jgi:hypothetical protein